MTELEWLRQGIVPGTDITKLSHQDIVIACMYVFNAYRTNLPAQPYGYTYSMLADKIKRLAEEEKERAG